MSVGWGLLWQQVCILVTKVGEMKLVFVSCGRKCLVRSENAAS